MRKMGVITAATCVLCLVEPFKGREISLGMAQEGQRLTLQEAIAVARRNPRTEKLGGTFSVLREIVSNADARRVGDQAFAQARANHIKLYKNGILADILRSGGFLLIQISPPTNKTNNVNPPPFVSALHLVSLGRDGAPKDVFWGPGMNLANTQELVKDTTEFTEELYSTRPSEAMSLERRFYGGRFPEGDLSQDSLFAIPHSLLKLRADPNEVREVAALYGGLQLSGFQYAVSMPAFAANPIVATQAADEKWEALKAEFLRNNRMDPHFDFDPENIRSKKQLRERVELLTRLDKFLDDSLKNEGDPTVVRANLSIATLPLGVGATSGLGQDIYSSSTPSLIVIYWQRLATGAFAVYGISEAG